ncbi:MAG: hypothetical protein KDD62_05175 [Bdellovibrionales bacterium]|nr:hypothetical protein [Bdellovibrionales bacterium]
MSEKKDGAPLKYLERLAALDKRSFSMSKEFINFLQFMNSRALKEQEDFESGLRGNYKFWADHYELLKREFNAVWDFFQEIENTVEGWYCVSPNLARFKTINVDRGGYTFAACIMKNHHRDAPQSEKSVSVTFGIDPFISGIGDERVLGRQGDVDDNLIGLENCTGKSLREQYQGSMALCNSLAAHHLLFRLNHHQIGQETTKMGIDILHKYSLVELCEKLYLAVNNDILAELSKELPESKTFLIDS